MLIVNRCSGNTWQFQVTGEDVVAVSSLMQIVAYSSNNEQNITNFFHWSQILKESLTRNLFEIIR